MDRTSWRLALLLAVVIAAAYSNSLDIGFRFNDWHVVEENPHIRSLAHLGRFFVDPNTTSVLRENKDLGPLLMVSFALNYALSGEAPWSYHVVNLLLHWLVALLVLRIVRDHLWLGSERLAVAAAAALVVAVHPLNTEPVDYVSARSALLTAAFYLGAFDAFARARRGRCLVLFALALLTKAIAVTLPVAVIGYWLLARSRTSAGERPSPPWPFFAALVGLAVAGVAYRLVLLPPWTMETARQPGITRWVYLMTEWSAYLYYLRLFLWPDALVIDRVDYPYAYSLSDPRAWGSLVGLLALGGVAWRARHRWPALTFAALWYAVALAAESTIFPLAEPVNEHRPYLSMLGLGTAAGVALWGLASLGAREERRRVLLFAGLLVVLTTALGAATFGRNRTWKNEYDLWRDATEKAPENSRAWLNAGHVAIAEGRLDDARRLLLEAHRLDPCYAYVQMNLSALEARQGELAASLRWAEDSLRCQLVCRSATTIAPWRWNGSDGMRRRSRSTGRRRRSMTSMPTPGWRRAACSNSKGCGKKRRTPTTERSPSTRPARTRRCSQGSSTTTILARARVRSSATGPSCDSSRSTTAPTTRSRSPCWAAAGRRSAGGLARIRRPRPGDRRPGVHRRGARCSARVSALNRPRPGNTPHAGVRVRVMCRCAPLPADGATYLRRVRCYTKPDAAGARRSKRAESTGWHRACSSIEMEHVSPHRRGVGRIIQ